MKEGKIPDKSIFSEVDISSYLQGVKNCNLIEKTVQVALKSMEDNPSDYRLHVDNVHEFMKALWAKYDCLEVFDILDALTRIEPALLDIERDPEASKGYRDHYVHLFHVFILGLRIISAMIKKLGNEKACRVFKVRDESLNDRIYGYDQDRNRVKFRDYTWKERLFYLWTLMSTLHDIAIPITHLNRIREALNRFSEKFHLEISGPILVPSFPTDLDIYLDLLSRIFQGKLMPGKENWRYDKEIPNAYVKGQLERLFIERDHGVLGGFLVYKKTEEIFLQGKSKYKLDPDSFQNYKEIVLEEDIARAALAISLHNLKLEFPSFMPLNFFDYPLCFLLILADSLQEYLRWEGKSIRGNTKLRKFPEINVTLKNKNRFSVECNLFVDEDPNEQEYFCNAVKDMMQRENTSSIGNTIKDAANDISRLLEDDITKKLLLNDYFTVSLSFYEEDRHLCTHTFRT